LGKAGLAGAAAVAGYEIGKLINSLGPDGDLGAWIGGKIYDATHPQYDPNAPKHGGSGRRWVEDPSMPGSGRRWVEDPSMPGSGHWESSVVAGKGAPGGGKTTQINLNIDGHKIGSVLFDVGGKNASGPQTGTSLFDPTQAPYQAGGLGF
jgi:hypothetical protein